MSNTAALAAVLHCVFSPVGHETGPDKLIGVMDVPLDEEYTGKLASMTPPRAELQYVGEPANQREWVFHDADPDDPNGYIIVRLVPTRDVFNPYSFRMGRAIPVGGDQYRFDQIQSGQCELKSSGQNAFVPSGARP